MAEAKTSVVKRSLFSWVRESDTRLQILLLIVIGLTVGARVLPLEMQKRVVNQAIKFQDVHLLFVYCGLYLAAVLTASGLKYVIVILQTWLGQQALAALRKALYSHILRLPLNFFRKTPAGMVVSALVNEVSTSGEFVGQAIAVPVTNVLTLLAFAIYLLWLNPMLALISLATYPVVAWFLPKIQARANEANKKRVDETRALSSKIGEAISGIHEVHGNSSYRIEEKKYNGIIDRLFRIRITWNLYKDGAKVFNNFFVNLSPFLVFIVGGYLCIKGRFDLGSLVAFVSAQEKLYDPWKELMEFYQTYQDASVRYRRTLEYFDAEPEHILDPPEGREPLALPALVEVRDLSYTVEGGITLLNGVNLDLVPGEHLALVGFSGSGKSTLAQCIAQLYKYTGGSVRLGGMEVGDVSKRDMALSMGLVSQTPFIFEGTIRENLLYSCEAVTENEGLEHSAPPPTLDDMIQALQQTGLFVDVLRFGLNAILPAEGKDDLRERLIRVRESFRRDFGKELSDVIEFFDEGRYLQHSSVAANIIFGFSSRPGYQPERLPENPQFRAFLDEAQLTRPLMGLAAEALTQTVDILGEGPPDHALLERSPIAFDEYDAARALAGRLAKTRINQLPEEDRVWLLRLSLRFTPGLHKTAAFPPMMADLILEARDLFREKITREDPGAFSFYRMTDLIPSQSILENILFGRVRTDNPQAQDAVNQAVMQLLIEEDLLETVVETGMEFQVGTKGDRLSGGQRQKLAIARVFLKRPALIIMDEATSALDNKSQSRIQNIIETRLKGRNTVIAVVHRLDIIKNFDKVAVMKAGKIVEIGTYDDLMAKKGMLHELVSGKKSGGAAGSQ